MRTLSFSAALAAAFAAVAALAAPTSADNPQLEGTVGPGFSISLKDTSGATVTHLDAGTYSLVVHDLADVHDFHLSGPGVDQAVTDVEFVGDRTVTVTLTDGTYSFFCAPHAAQMHGTFAVGTATVSGGGGGGDYGPPVTAPPTKATPKPKAKPKPTVKHRPKPKPKKKSK